MVCSSTCYRIHGFCATMTCGHALDDPKWGPKTLWSCAKARYISRPRPALLPLALKSRMTRALFEFQYFFGEFQRFCRLCDVCIEACLKGSLLIAILSPAGQSD